MADSSTMRSAVELLMTRLLAGGETELPSSSCIQISSTTRRTRSGETAPSGAAATSEWLRSCFGDLRYDIHRVFIDGDMPAAYVTMHGRTKVVFRPVCLQQTSRSP